MQEDHHGKIVKPASQATGSYCAFLQTSSGDRRILRRRADSRAALKARCTRLESELTAVNNQTSLYVAVQQCLRTFSGFTQRDHPAQLSEPIAIQ